MSTFVLIHGGWAGGWVWERVVPELEAVGHTVSAPDLPAHGDDPAAPGEVSLDDYVARVLADVEAAAGPVVLVGHSSGGIVVTQAAQRRPERIGLVVYVAAYIPSDGQTLFDVAGSDAEGLVLPNLVVSEDGTSATIREGAVRDALFGDCTVADHERAAGRFRPEPVAPVATPVKLTDEGFGRVRRAYVVCSEDRAMGPALQRRMAGASGCHPVRSMATGHMPQYADPAGLASVLDGLPG